jgi:hypothetical protein
VDDLIDYLIKNAYFYLIFTVLDNDRIDSNILAAPKYKGR